MSEIGVYLRKARTADGVVVPIIASPQDAVRAVRAAGARLDGLPPAERLALLSDLQELSNVLSDQIARLDREMSDIQSRLSQARSSRLACSRYVQTAAVAGASVRGH